MQALDPSRYRNAIPPLGSPSMASAGLALDLARRTDDLQAGLLQVAQNYLPYPTEANRLAVANYADPIHDDQKVEVWIYAAIGGQPLSVSTTGAPFDQVSATSSSGWNRLGPLRLRPGSTIRATRADYVLSVCVLTAGAAYDPGATPAVVPPRTFIDPGQDVPYDVDLVDHVNEVQSAVQANAQRTLFSRSYGTRTGFNLLLYKFRRGAYGGRSDVGGATLWIRFKTDTTNTGVLGYGVTAPDGTFTEDSVSPVTATAGTPTWQRFDIPASAFLSEFAHDLAISVGAHLTILSVVLLESPYTEAEGWLYGQSGPVDDLLFAEDAGTGRIDQHPERYLPAAQRPAQGRAIVGTYWETDTQARWGDGRSLLHNAFFCALWRPQVLVWDCLLTETWTPSADAVSFASWVHQPSRGSRGLEIEVAASLSSSSVVPWVSAWVDGFQVTQEVRLSTPVQEGTRAIITLDLPDLTGPVEIDLKYVFRDEGEGLVTSGDEEAVPRRVMVREVPQSASAAEKYFRDEQTTPLTVPATSSGVTSTIAIPFAFTVRCIRIGLAVTVGASHDLAFFLKGPGGSYVEFTPTALDTSGDLVSYSWQAFTDKVVSDAYGDGLTSADLLKDFDDGNWTLKVSNVGGANDATIVSWAIELT